MVETKEVKAIVEMKLPKNVDKNIGKACKDLAQTLKKVISPISKITELYLIDAPCTLFAPLSAYLKGKSNEIAYKYLPFQNQIEMRKELSQIKTAQYVLENLVDKEQKGEEIPSKIEDTDTLFTIQNAASETSDEDFIKFWAKLYTEEACKPNTISKKTVNLCKDLNKEVVQTLENNIFPYCDSYGFYFGDSNKNIESLIIAEEYGFVRTSEQRYVPAYINIFKDIKIGQYRIYICPGYDYKVYYEGKILTNTALEVRKCLKLDKDINIKDIASQIEKSSKEWKVFDEFKSYINYKNHYPYKFFVVEKDKVIYPIELEGKSVGEVYNDILSNIEYKEGAKQFFDSSGVQIQIYG